MTSGTNPLCRTPSDRQPAGRPAEPAPPDPRSCGLRRGCESSGYLGRCQCWWRSSTSPTQPPTTDVNPGYRPESEANRSRDNDPRFADHLLASAGGKRMADPSPSTHTGSGAAPPCSGHLRALQSTWRQQSARPPAGAGRSAGAAGRAQAAGAAGALTSSGRAFLATSTSAVKAAASLTAISASARRSTSTPAALRPWMRRL